MNKFSIRLKKALDENNMKMTELAKESGIGKSSISDWLSGKYEAKQKNIFLLARALKVDEGWLMGLDVPMKKPKPISSIYEELEPSRQKKVYNFAENQLEQQNNNKDILTAAHMDEDLSEDDQQKVNDYIEKLKKEHEE